MFWTIRRLYVFATQLGIINIIIKKIESSTVCGIKSQTISFFIFEIEQYDHFLSNFDFLFPKKIQLQITRILNIKSDFCVICTWKLSTITVRQQIFLFLLAVFHQIRFVLFVGLVLQLGLEFLGCKMDLFLAEMCCFWCVLFWVLLVLLEIKMIG